MARYYVNNGTWSDGSGALGNIAWGDVRVASTMSSGSIAASGTVTLSGFLSTRNAINNAASWGTSKTFTCNVKVSTANSNVTIKAKLDRVNDTNGSTITTGAYGTAVTMTSTGNITVTTGATTYGTGATSDRFLLVFQFTNTNSMTAQSAAIATNDDSTYVDIDMNVPSVTVTANDQFDSDDLTPIAVGAASADTLAGNTKPIYLGSRVSSIDPWQTHFLKTEVKAVGTAFTSSVTSTGYGPKLREAYLITARRGAVMDYDSINQRYITVGGYDGTTRFADLWELSAHGERSRWTRLLTSAATNAPVGKNLGTGVMINQNNKAWFVYWGGTTGSDTNDMRIVDCTTRGSETWTSVTQTSAPAVRSYITHHMADVPTDSTHTDVYLFGGWGASRTNDLVKVTLNTGSTVPTALTWSTVTANGAGGSPSARSGAFLWYDSAQNRLMLFGGYNGTTYLADLWQYSLSSPGWSQLSPTGTAPAGRELFSGGWDETTRKFFYFGGWQGAVANDRNDIGQIDFSGGTNGAFLQLRANGISSTDNLAFAPLSSGSDCVDTNRRIIVNFGQNALDTTDKYVYAFPLDNTETTNATMYGLNVIDHYRGGDAPSYAVDTSRNVGILSGGFSNMGDEATIANGDHHNEIWEYDYSANTLRYANSGWLGQVPREGTLVVYDSTGDRFLAFGGLNMGSQVSNELWELKRDTYGNYKARHMQPSGTLPGPRWLCAGAYDSARNRLVIWGGTNSTAMIANTDCWQLDLSSGDGTWSSLSPTGTPPAAVWQPGYAYRSSTKRLYVASGATNFAASTFSTRLDYLDLTNATPAWTNVFTTGITGVRGSVVNIDDTNGYIHMFGGYNGSVVNNTHYFINLSSGAISTLSTSSTPTARRSAGGWFLNGKFYITRGRPVSGEWFSDTQELTPNYGTPNSSTWSNKRPTIIEPMSDNISGLTNNTSYHWQQWVTVGSTDSTASSFGGNAESAADFIVGTAGHPSFTKTHTTDSNKRKSSSRSHTTDSIARKQFSITHTTSSNLKKSGITRTHTTDANKKKTLTVQHTTDSNKKKSGITLSHTTDSNKKKSGLTRTHTTDSLKRQQFTKTHTTDAGRHPVNFLSTIETFQEILTQDYTINTTGTYAEINAISNPTYYQHRYLWDPSKWDGVSAIYFESQIQMDAAGTVFVELYNLTDSVSITGSQLSTTNTTSNVSRSADISANLPSSPKTLILRAYTTNAGHGFVNTGRLVVQQGSSATKFEQAFEITQADFVNGTTTPFVDKFSSLWLYEASKFDSITSITIEFNAAVFGSVTGTYEMWDYTNSSVVSGTTMTTSSTTNVVLTSSDIKANLVDGHEYCVRVTASSAAGGTSVSYGGARIRIDQQYATKTQMYLTGICAGLFADTNNDGVQLDPGAFDSNYGKQFYAEIVYLNNSSTGTGRGYAKDASGTEITNSSVTSTAGDTNMHRARNSSQMPWPASATFYRPNDTTVVSPGSVMNVWRGVINVYIKNTFTKTHTTDANKRKALSVIHSTDSNKKKSGLTVSHTTSANKRKSGLTVFHTTDSNKKKSGLTVAHTTDSNKKKSGLTVTHSTDANKKLSGNTRTHTTDSLKRIQNTRTHTTDTNKKKSLSVFHTADSNKKKSGLTVTHTTSANRKVAGNTRTHTTDSLKRITNTRSHTTDSLKRSTITKTHTTDSLLRKQFTKTHTTDANKRKATLATHTTDSNKRKSLSVVHTTDANKKKSGLTVSHTTSSNKRISGLTKTHTTDSLLRKQFTKTHTTDANRRKATTVTHTTDANKKKTGLTVSHTTSANKRKSGLILTHTTDANKRKSGLTLSHTTDASARKFTKAHTTDAYRHGRRYWVGNGGNWSDTAHWSLTSGGSSGASVPTLDDDVIFDANSFSSNGQTITLADSTTYYARGVTFAAINKTATLAFGNYTHLNTYDADFILSSNLTVTAGNNAAAIFITTNTGIDITFNTAGITLPTYVDIESSGNVTLGANVNIPNNLFQVGHNAGATTFDTAGYNITANQIDFSDNLVTINFNNSILTLTDTGSFGGYIVISALNTVNANTSTIVVDSHTRTTSIDVKGAQMYDLTVNSGNMTIDSDAKFRNVTLLDGMSVLVSGGKNIRVSGTLTFDNTSGGTLQSSSAGTPFIMDGFSNQTVRKVTLKDSTVNTISPTYAVSSPTYSLSTLTGAATTLSLGDDGISSAITIPFTFNYFGTNYTSLKISANGAISFDTSIGGLNGYPNRLPSAASSNIIDGFRTDWDSSSGGTIKYETIGSAGSRIFVAEWNNVPIFGGGTPNGTFQIKLFETSNDIEIHIGSGQARNTYSATSGITNSTGLRSYYKSGRDFFTTSVTNDAAKFVQTVTNIRWEDLNGVNNGGNTGWIFAYTKTHTTDSLKRKQQALTHTADANKKKSGITVTHTTDAYRRNSTLTTTRTHTTDSLLRKQVTKTHTTDSLKRKQFNLTHSTDSNKKKTTTQTHTTDSNKKKSGIIITHTTDANKKKSGLTRTHTTDTYLRRTVTAKLTQRIEMAVGAYSVGGTANTYIEVPDVMTRIDTSAFDGDVKYYFEVALKNNGTTGQTAYVELYNRTDSVSVSGSEQTNTVNDSFPQYRRSGALSLSGDKVYTIRLKHSNTTTNSAIYGARIVVVQTGDITKTQIHQELGSESVTSSTSSTNQLTNLGRFLYESSKYDGTVTVRHDAVVKTTASNTVTSGIYDITASSVVSGSEVSKSNDTTFSLLSSGNITLTDGHVYIPTGYVSAGGSVTFESNKLVFTIGGGFSKFLAYVLISSPGGLGPQNNGSNNYPNYNAWIGNNPAYDTADFIGLNLTTYYEADIAVNNSARTAYSDLETYVHATSATSISGSLVTKTGDTSISRVRSGSFAMPSGFNELNDGISSDSGSSNALRYNSYLVIEGNQFNEITNVITHTTDALKRAQVTKTHTTDALKRKQNTVSHTADSYLRKGGTRTHTTDANKKKSGITVTHTTDANKKRSGLTVQHTTDANKKKSGLTVFHTTSANKRKSGLTLSHTTDTLARKQFTKTHTTDANRKKSGLIVVHTTDANKKKSTLVLHTTDANKKLTGNTRTHTTDSLKRKQFTLTHTTDANKKKSGLTVQHSTDSNKKKSGLLVSHTTDANRKLAGFSRTHTTDSLKRKQFTVVHTTDANKKKAGNTLSHTTDGLKRIGGLTRTHTTDSLKRQQFTKTHTTDSNKRLATTKTHTTDANKRKATTRTHTTDTNKITAGITRSHTTDALKATRRTHLTDALKTTGSTSTQYTFQTASGSDDGNEVLSSGAMNITDDGQSGTVARLDGTNHGGFRFPNVTIAQGTTITSAIFKFDQLANYTGSGNIGSRIYLQNVDNAAQFTTTTSDISSRARTTNTVINPSATLAVFQTNGVDVTTLVQEVLNRSGWASGNAMAVLIIGQGVAGSFIQPYMYEYFSGFYRARLVITLTTTAAREMRRQFTTDSMLKKVFTRTHTTDANKRKATTATHTTSSNKRLATTKTHTTDANKKKQTLVAHTTDANKKKSGLTVQHTTDANRRKSYVVTHTTDSNKKKTTTVFHTTDSNKKLSGNTRTHTTDSLIRKTVTKTHTTSSFLRSGNTVGHTTDSNKKRTTTVQHTTDSNKRKSGLTLTHSTDSNKKKSGNVLTHTTNSLVRKANTRTHTTDANKKLSGITRTHTTDTLLRRQLTKTHTTDSNKRRATLVSHTTDANKKKVGNLLTHTTDANKKKAGLTRTHTTDSLLRQQFTKTHTTDANKRKATTKTHTTDAFTRSGFTITHTTDANKRKATLRTHTTDANKRKSGNLLSHTTDSLKRKTNVVSHATDSLKRKATTKTHTTDSLLRKQFTKTHTTDSLKRKQFTVNHTTDSNKKKSGLLVTHTTDANKKKSGNTRTHTTDALKRQQFTKTHTTNSLLRKANTRTHTTDSNKRKATTVSHTTSAFLHGANVLTHTTDANKKKTGNTRTHTTDASKKIIRSVVHTTDAFKRIRVTISHTTDANKRRATLVSHLTDALKRKGNILTHTTSSNKRKATFVNHTTDANKRRAGALSYTTDANKRRANIVISHTTDALKRSINLLVHTTDTNKRRSYTVDHTVDSNKKRGQIVSHTTDTSLSGAFALLHSTDSYIFSQRGNKKVLINGVWHYGQVKVLVGSVWKIAIVKYYNGSSWVYAYQ